MSERDRSSHIDFLEFPARDATEMKQTKNFFNTVFGWKYTAWGADYCDTKDSGVGSGINADSDHRPAHVLAVIHVGNLEAVRERIIKSGGAVTREIFSFPGGRRFHFTDPAGNELAAWSDL